MVLFFTTTLAVSIVGLISLLVLKRWELSTGAMVGGRMRPQVGGFFQRGLLWAEQVLPLLVRLWGREAARALRGFAHRAIAQIVLLTESLLERSLTTLRHATEHKPVAAGEASAFLREVAEHKKQLQNGRVFDTISGE